MLKIIVSACLAGDNCKYNGGNNFNQKTIELPLVKNPGPRTFCRTLY